MAGALFRIRRSGVCSSIVKLKLKNMTYLFKKDVKFIADTASLCSKELKFYDAILFHTPKDINILRWEEQVSEIIVEFDYEPNELSKYGQKTAHKFKPNNVLIFDMQKMFDGGNDEHPSVTVEKLKMNCLSYIADPENMSAKMIVFDGFDNAAQLPEWVTVI